jgi:hypothetical protein
MASLLNSGNRTENDRHWRKITYFYICRNIWKCSNFAFNFLSCLVVKKIKYIVFADIYIEILTMKMFTETHIMEFVPAFRYFTMIQWSWILLLKLSMKWIFLNPMRGKSTNGKEEKPDQDWPDFQYILAALQLVEKKFKISFCLLLWNRPKHREEKPEQKIQMRLFGNSSESASVFKEARRYFLFFY